MCIRKSFLWLLVLVPLLAVQVSAGVFGRRFANDIEVKQYIANPTDDSGECYLTVFTSAKPQSNVREATLLNNLKTNTALVSLQRQVKYKEYPASDAMFKRYLPYVGTTMPVIVLQEPPKADGTGTIIYKASGANIPLSGSELAGEINIAIGNYFTKSRSAAPTYTTVSNTNPTSGFPRPFHHPDKPDSPCKPEAPGETTTVQTVVPDVGVPDDEPVGSHLPLMIGLGVAGLALGIAVAYRNKLMGNGSAFSPALMPILFGAGTYLSQRDMIDAALIFVLALLLGGFLFRKKAQLTTEQEELLKIADFWTKLGWVQMGSFFKYVALLNLEMAHKVGLQMLAVFDNPDALRVHLRTLCEGLLRQLFVNADDAAYLTKVVTTLNTQNAAAAAATSDTASSTAAASAPAVTK